MSMRWRFDCKSDRILSSFCSSDAIEWLPLLQCGFTNVIFDHRFTWNTPCFQNTRYFSQIKYAFGHYARMSEEKIKTVPVSIRVLPAVRDELLRIAKEERRTLSQTVNFMIEAELVRRAKKPKK